MIRTLWCVALALAYTVAACAQRPSLEVLGYAKNLGIRLTSSLTEKAHFLDIGRFRARGVLSAGGHVRAEVWLDTELLTGSYLQSADYAYAQTYGRPRPLHLEWTLGTGKSHEVRQRLFRAFVATESARATLTVGRQRIAWGSGFAWNPTDVLNPFNPGAIELGERAGADAAHLSVPLGPLSRLELVAAYMEAGAPSSYAVRAGTNYRAYDVTALAGRFRRDWMVGGDFAGYLQGAGIRGEAAYVWRDAALNFLRAVLNTDYTFARGIYGLAELYYNGRGSARKAEYDFADLLTGDTFNLAQWYVAVSVAVSITPLVGAGLYQLANLNDGSMLVGPSITYSLSQSLEAAAAAYFFTGTSGSEYAAQQHVYFVTLQWYY